MVIRQLKDTGHRTMGATLYVVSMVQVIRNYKLVFKTFYIIECHSQWFRLRLWYLHGFDYEITILAKLLCHKNWVVLHCVVYLV